MRIEKIKIVQLAIVSFCVAFLVGCGTSEDKKEVEKSTTSDEAVEEVVIENFEIVVLEDGFSHSDHGKVSLHTEDSEDEMTPVRPITHDEFIGRVKPMPHIEPIPTEIEITESIIPLSETETLSAYNSKGKEKGRIEVIHDSQTGEIVSVTYAHKHHKDQYDVQTGMTVKDVKKLRKKMKHMMHRGDHYLYSDESHIMYILDIKDDIGNELTDVEFDDVVVQAIVWKDKKHHTDMVDVAVLSE
jgi:hypothetical protein